MHYCALKAASKVIQVRCRECGATRLCAARRLAVRRARSRAGATELRGCILFIITDDDPRPGPVAISPAIIAILFIVIAFITLLVTDFTVCRF